MQTGTLTWTDVAGCTSYNVYKYRNSLYGFIGRAGTGTSGFTDTTILADTSNTPPQLTNPFSGTGNWPACSTYYLQRQVFADSTNKPQTLWFSNVGAFNNMNVAQPTKDSDAITRTLIGRQVNEIRHLVPGSSLLVMTSGAEWRCYPGPSAPALTPSACTTLPQTAFGCSHVPPVQTANSVLFVQERGSRVRELRFDVLQDQYQAPTCGAESRCSTTPRRSTRCRNGPFARPFRIIWSVRDDGVLLGFTYALSTRSMPGTATPPTAPSIGVLDRRERRRCRLPDRQPRIGGQTRRYIRRPGRYAL